MDKLLYILSLFLFAACIWVGFFNVKLILATPDVTLATAANLLIFPGNLFLQSLLFASLGLVLGKLNRILRRHRPEAASRG